MATTQEFKKGVWSALACVTLVVLFSFAIAGSISSFAGKEKYDKGKEDGYQSGRIDGYTKGFESGQRESVMAFCFSQRMGYNRNYSINMREGVFDAGCVNMSLWWNG